jgi:hypothetical protein
VTRTTWVALAAGACLLASGCANTRLYNAADDALAKKAGDAVAAADLKSALVPERAAMQELSKREQEAVRRDQLGLRDRKVAAILSATKTEFGWDFLDSELAGRQRVLAGSLEAARAIETAILQRDDAAAKLVLLRQNYLVLTRGRVSLSCPVSASQRPEAGSELAMAMRPFENACTAFQKAATDLQAALSQGAIGGLTANIAEVDGARAEFELQLAASKSAYQQALAQSKAKDQADKRSTLDTLKAKFDGLLNIPKPPALLGDKVLAKLTESAKLEKVLAERQALEDLIQAFDGQLPAQGATSAQERLAALRSLADASNSPAALPLTALILQAEHLRLEAAGIDRSVSRAKERIALLRKKQAAMVEEVRSINSAQKAVADFSAASACGKRASLYDTFIATTPSCRFVLAQALSDYVNATTLGRVEQELIDYQLIAQGHEAALDESETALAQTDNLMRVPASQLAKAYGSGVRPEDISNLVNALGLGAIAVRVK